jgi:hypothetical protein
MAPIVRDYSKFCDMLPYNYLKFFRLNPHSLAAECGIYDCVTLGNLDSTSILHYLYSLGAAS